MNKLIHIFTTLTLSITALTMAHPTKYGALLIALNDPALLGREQLDKNTIYGQAGTIYGRGGEPTIGTSGIDQTIKPAVQPHDSSTVYDPEGRMTISTGGGRWGNNPYFYRPVETPPIK